MRNLVFCAVFCVVAGLSGLIAADSSGLKQAVMPVGFVPQPSPQMFSARTLGGVVAFDLDGPAWRSRSGDLVRQRFLNSTTVAVEGRAAAPGLVYDYRGRGAARSAQGLPMFGELVYRGVYPGIDVVYSGKRGRLKRDIVVAPGADPHRIRMGFEGISGLCINADGALSVATPSGSLLEARPFVYQLKDGKRRVVSGHFLVTANDEVGFVLGDYDRDLPVVIDPVIIVTGLLGGSGGDSILGTFADDNNYYFTGRTTSDDFPTLNPHQGGNAGDPDSVGDAFLACYRKSDFQLIYATYFGGSGSDQANAVYVDDFGNAAIAGWTNSTDLPTFNAIQDVNGGLTDGFAARFNAVGVLEWATYVGGEGDDQFADMDGNNFFDKLTLVGFTNSTDFPLQDAGDSTCGCASGTGTDAVYTRLNFDGTLDVSTFLGGSVVGGSSSNDVALDVFVLGSTAYVAGWTEAADFPTQPFSQAYAGGKDAFFTQFGFDGQRDYSIVLGGSGDEVGDGIAAFNLSEVILTGSTTSDTDFPVTDNALQSTYGGGESDAFIARINGDTSPRNRMTSYWGGSGMDAGREIEFTRDAGLFLNIYTFAGITDSVDFPTGDGGVSSVGAGNGIDSFLFSGQNSGNNDFLVDNGTLVGGPGDDGIFSLNADAAGGPFTVFFGGATSDPTGLANGAGTPSGTGEGGFFGSICPDLNCVLPVQADLKLTITKREEGPVEVGHFATYDFTVENIGDGVATGVDMNFFMYSSNVTEFPDPIYPCSSQYLDPAVFGLCELPDMNPDDVIVLDIETIVLELNSAPFDFPVVSGTVSSTSNDQNPGNNLAAVNFEIIAEVPGGIGSNVTGDIALGVTDPVATNNGSFYFETPLLDLGGPMPLAAGLVYRSDLPSLFDSINLPRFWFRPFATMAADVTLNGATYTAVQLPNGDIVSFVKDGADWNRVSGDVDLGFATATGNSVSIPYVLQESGDWFYLTDPRFGRIYLFEDVPEGVLLRAIMDRNSNTHTYRYDMGDGNPPSAVEDGLGRRLNFTYESIGGTLSTYLSTITDQTGRTVSFTYEAAGTDNGGQLTLRSVTDVMGGVTNFEYAGPDLPNQRLTRVVRPNGIGAFRNTYDWRELNGLNAQRVVSQEILTADPLGDNTLNNTFTYDPETNQVTFTDSQGVVTVHQSNNHHGPNNQHTDGAGNSTTITFVDDQVERVRNRDGHETVLQIAPDTGEVIGVTNPLGQTRTVTLTENVQTFVNPFGGGEFSGRFFDRTREDFADGTATTQTFDDRGNLIGRVDRNGRQTTFGRDGMGLLVSLDNPEGGVQSVTRDSAGNVATLTDSDTGQIEFTVDGAFRVTEVLLPDGSTVRLTWRADNQPESITDARGNTRLLDYDPNGRMDTITGPDGGVDTFTYTIQDEPESMIDPEGRFRSYDFNSANQLVGIDDGSGVPRVFGYNPAGFRTSVRRDGAGFDEVRSNDGLLTGIMPSSGDPGVALNLDANGHVIEVETPLKRSFTFGRDENGRITSKTAPSGANTILEYDGEGGVTSVTFPGNLTFSITRNGLGQGTEYQDPSGASFLRSFSSMGRATGFQDPMGRATHYDYDTSGRLNGIGFPDGSNAQIGHGGLAIDSIGFQGPGAPLGGFDLELEFGYDNRTNLISANGISLSYDAADRLTGWERNGAAFSQTYDAAGRVDTMVYPDGMTVTYEYNGRGQLISVADDLTQTLIDISYDEKGNRIGMSRSNGVNTVWSWDADGFMVGLSDGPVEGEAFLDLQYSFGPDGRVTAESGVSPTAAAALLTADERQLTFDAAGQITSEGYAYDARGRQTLDPQIGVLGWDLANRLVAAGGKTYEYDGLNQLVAVNDGSVVRYHPHPSLGGSRVLVEQAEASKRGARHRSYVFTPGGELLYGIDHANGDAPFFYHYDRIGHTRVLTDNSGGVIKSFAYDPFGALLGGSNLTGEVTILDLYAAAAQDGGRNLGNGLILKDRRVYHSFLGRFLSPMVRFDTVDHCTAGVSDLNAYVFAGNTPQDVKQPRGVVRIGADSSLNAHSVLDENGEPLRDESLLSITDRLSGILGIPSIGGNPAEQGGGILNVADRININDIPDTEPEDSALLDLNGLMGGGIDPNAIVTFSNGVFVFSNPQSDVLGNDEEEVETFKDKDDGKRAMQLIEAGISPFQPEAIEPLIWLSNGAWLNYLKR